ncbi:MAG: LemA family protein [Magnetococcus sp. DMHC-6]
MNFDMSGTALFWSVFWVVLIGGILYFIALFNKLIKLKNLFCNGYAQIDVQLKRRYDLIPNLVETAKSYLVHERATLEAVIQARNGAVTASSKARQNPGDSQSMGALGAAESQLSSTLKGLFALMEAYPQLQADHTLSRLHEELVSTENRITFARQFFNDAVMDYNTARESFPELLIAQKFNFPAATLLESIESPVERLAVRVKM